MGFVKELLRIPSATKSVDSRVLNLAGTQVARTLAARVIQRSRRWPEPANPDVLELRRSGVLMIPGFLPPAEFAALQKECAAVLADQAIPRSSREHGRNELEQIDALPLCGGRPALRAFLENERLRSLIEGAERRRIEPLAGHRVIERLVQKEGFAPDLETALHIDTFFHTHKVWLYLSEVSLKQGPLVYVPGSHRLTWRHLAQGYRASLAGKKSRRIAYEEVVAHGLEEVVYTCPPNTLLVANTAGYHRRLPGVPGQERLAVQLSYRFNPFFPAWVDLERHQERVRKLLDRARA